MKKMGERFSQHQPDEATWVDQGFDDPLGAIGVGRPPSSDCW